MSSLTAPSTKTSGSYTVSWTAASAATSYRLEERVNSGSWSQIYSGSSRSKAISGKGTATYSYRVRACNADGCGVYSTAKSVSVTRIPATPTFTTATLTKPSGRRWVYTLDWTSSSGATSYELWGPTYNSLNDQVQIYLGPNTSYTHEIFSFDEPTVGFKVRACNSIGCSSYRWVNP